MNLWRRAGMGTAPSVLREANFSLKPHAGGRAARRWDAPRAAEPLRATRSPRREDPAPPSDPPGRSPSSKPRVRGGKPCGGLPRGQGSAALRVLPPPESTVSQAWAVRLGRLAQSPRVAKPRIFARAFQKCRGDLPHCVMDGNASYRKERNYISPIYGPIWIEARVLPHRVS
jgi:hypothetical protein